MMDALLRRWVAAATFASASLVAVHASAQDAPTLDVDPLPPPLPAALPEPPKPPASNEAAPPVAPRRVQLKAPSLASRLDWRWPRFGWAQFGLTVGQGALALVSVAIPGSNNWSGTNAFDEAARNALGVQDPDAALHARDASDIGLVLLLNQQLVDTLFVTWWYHDKGSTALQMALIDLQTLSFSAGLNSLVAGLVGRERPYGRDSCAEGDLAQTSDCQGNNRYRSFFSGHATAAFTLAALTCVHHINLPIYGGGPGEAAPCIAAMAVASAVAILRVSSDQHYLSDVLVGAAFGTLSGFGVPYLFHYAQTPDKRPNAALNALGILGLNVAPMPTGLQMAGLF